MTGGSGLLGRNLKIEADRPSHEELDICNLKIDKGYDLIVHSAAYTNTTKAEIDRLKCFDVNVTGTLNLLEAFKDTPFVYISSEYAYNPVNFYSLTKSLAEQLVKEHKNYLIIRTLFKPYPYPYERAFVDQWTNGDTVDKIAPLIDKEIEEWDGKGKRAIYIGTGRKTLFELAKVSKPDVLPITIKEWSEITKIKYPYDYR